MPDGNINSGAQPRRTHQPAAGGNRQHNEGSPAASSQGGNLQPDQQQNYNNRATSQGSNRQPEPRADNYRATTHAGDRYEEPAPRVPLTNVRDRLGPLGPPAGNDSRLHLKMLEASRLIEEEDMAEHKCLGPRIAQEPFPRGFMLPKDTPNMTTAPSRKTGSPTTPPGSA